MAFNLSWGVALSFDMASVWAFGLQLVVLLLLEKVAEPLGSVKID